VKTAARLVADDGDEFPLPVFGNFDPPVQDLNRANPEGNLNFNVTNLYDVNADGIANARDLLSMLREIKVRGNQVFTSAARSAPYLDVLRDGAFNPRDIAAELAYLMTHGLRGDNSDAEGEDLSSLTPLNSRDSRDLYFAEFGLPESNPLKKRTSSHHGSR
jgi:hypothetical protein